jgi:hypothetical protein
LERRRRRKKGGVREGGVRGGEREPNFRTNQRRLKKCEASNFQPWKNDFQNAMRQDIIMLGRCRFSNQKGDGETNEQ